MLSHHLSDAPEERARLSYAVRRIASPGRRPIINSYMLEAVLRETVLPTPQGQLENLILWLGQKEPFAGRRINVADEAISAVGAVDHTGLCFIAKHALSQGLIDGKYIPRSDKAEPDCDLLQVSLTFAGWSLFEELKRGRSQSKTAFMAMQFGDPELDQIFASYFRPATEATGFQLKRVDEAQPAGLIDDRLRIEIRTARFLIADLSHHNRGAYWEAGYAEGLGKPVIYTCKKDVFENKTEGTHFDTSHHLTIVWNPDDPSDAADRLKNTIRATIPEEAQLED
jgi:hypothetical protein